MATRRNSRAKLRALKRKLPSDWRKGVEKSCDKERFRTHLDAKLAAARIASWGNEYLPRPYRCNLCYGFHLTSQPQKTKRRRRRPPQESGAGEGAAAQP